MCLKSFFDMRIVFMEMYYLLDTDLYTQAHIWDYYGKRKGVFLDPSSNKCLEESSLHMDQDVSI